MSKKRRSADEIRRMVEDFQHSGLKRREFCQRHQIAMTTLDYWRRAQSRQPHLLEVEVAASEPAPSFAAWRMAGGSKAVGDSSMPNWSG